MMRIVIPDIPSNCPIAIKQYVIHICRALEREGVTFSTLGDGDPLPKGIDMYWDPYCYEGRNPGGLPSRSEAVPSVVSLHDAAPFVMEPVDYAGSVTAALQQQSALLDELAKWDSEQGRIDGLIVPDSFTKDAAGRYLAFPESRIWVAPWGMDAIEAASAHGQDSGPVGLLCVCQWRPSKNLGSLISAYLQLKSERRPPLTIIAPGFQEKLPAAPGLRLITRQMTLQELETYYAQALAFVYPVLHSSSGMPVLQAMAAGCPVLAADIPVLHELCRDAARFANPKDIDAFSEALETLVESDEARTKLENDGRARAATLTWERSAHAHMTAFREALTPWQERDSMHWENAGSPSSTAILVLGMHRSGTSALAGALSTLGVALGPKLMPASSDNPLGYFEHEEIVLIHEAILSLLGTNWHDPCVLPEGWENEPALDGYRKRLKAIVRRDLAPHALWALKDPRLCLLFPLWLSILHELGIPVKVILNYRDPNAVTASLMKRDGLELGTARLLWAQYLIEAERHTRTVPRFWIDYEQILSRPGIVLESAANALNIRWPIPPRNVERQFNTTIVPQFNHHRKQSFHLIEGALDLANEIFQCVRQETSAERLPTASLQSAFDRFAASFDWTFRGLKGPSAAGKASPYSEWLYRRDLQRALDKRYAPNEMRQWVSRPCFHMAALVLPGREPATVATASSFISQWYPSWKLSFLASGPAPDNLPNNERITWCQCDSNDIRGLTTQLVRAEDANWVGIIEAGDQLAEDALFQVGLQLQRAADCVFVYSDEDQILQNGQHAEPHFKPDFNLDLLRSMPYIGSLALVRRDVFTDVGLDDKLPGVEEYDLALKVYERFGAGGFIHVPDVLYHRSPGSGHVDTDSSKVVKAVHAALLNHLSNVDANAVVAPGPFPTTHQVRYSLHRQPLVSILIATRNQVNYLQRVVDTLFEKTSYPNYEVIIINNGSDDPECVRYLEGLKSLSEESGGRIRVLDYPGAFNYAAMMNRATELARGEYLLQLNNDTAILHPDWLEEMLGHAEREEVGIVGVRLLFPDGGLQHAGVILGLGNGGVADHVYLGEPHSQPGYFGRAQLTQDFSVVTAACLLISKRLYEAVGGMDEVHLQSLFNDVDLCLKVRQTGKLVVWTPFATLLHEGSKSHRDGIETVKDKEKEARSEREIVTMFERWMPVISRDPAYNPNLTLRQRRVEVEAAYPVKRQLGWNPYPRLLTHAADHEGCGEYRIIAPGRALEAHGLAEVWQTDALMYGPADIARASVDSIVLQRQLEDHQLLAMRRYRKFSQAHLVYELDDLLTNLPVRSAHRADIPKDIKRRFREAVSICDRLVVATESLAEAYGHLAPETVVMPNYLEGRRWGRVRGRHRESARPRVGWAGGVGHAGDLALVRGVVEMLSDEVDWVFFGMCPNALRPYVRELHPAVPLPSYPEALASLDLDLAIAPLEDNPFNHAKSNLRLLEYGAVGFPVVASDLSPYRGDLPVTRVRNRTRDWVEAIRERLADREALAAEGDRLRAAVHARWMLEDHLSEWLSAWLPASKVSEPCDVETSAGMSSAIENRQESRTFA